MGGQIIRDRDGTATGVLIDTGDELRQFKIPKPTIEDEKIALATAMHIRIWTNQRP